MKPFFSVIVPVYNVERYISQCVESILKQSFTAYELILVDDGSPDKCPQICDKYALNDARIKVVHKNNGGLVSARKAGIDIATGEYVVVVDSDDWIDINLLKVLKNEIEVSHCDVICYNYYFCSGDGVIRANQTCLEGVYKGESLNEIRNRFLYDPEKRVLNGGTLPCSIWTKAVRRGLYNECQYLVPDNISKAEDLLFTVHLLGRCRSICMLNYYGYYYRTNQNSISHLYNVKDIAELQRVVELVLIASSDYGDIYREKPYVYAIVAFWNLIAGLARQMQSASDFTNLLKKEYLAFFDYSINKIQVHKLMIKDRMKLFLIKNHFWKLIYRINKWRNCMVKENE